MKSLIVIYALSALLASTGVCFIPWQSQSNSIMKKIKTGYLDIATKDNKVVLTIRKENGAKFEAALYTKNPGLNGSATLSIEQDCEKLTTCIQLANKTHAKIRADPDSEVVKVSREIEHRDGELVDCFATYDDTELFGGPEWSHQRWPIQHMYFESQPYLPSHDRGMALAERYWLSSQGIYVYAEREAPLFLDQNNFRDRYLCLTARNARPYWPRDRLKLDYEIGVFADPKAAHRDAVARHLGKPEAHPSERMVSQPIWSTWARHKVDVDEAAVRRLAEEIVANGFDRGQIEIDDNWESCYGSANFDARKFPNATKLVADLKAMGFRVALWIHPFVNEGCNDGEAYEYARDRGYFVKGEDDLVRTSWWRGKDAAAIDFTNAEASRWWIDRLKKLQQKVGVDSFKFDAGESSWLPSERPRLSGPTELLPGIYTLNYTRLAASFGDAIEVRVGWHTQSLPVFVRMIDKDTRWTWNNGLPTLITTLLQMNLNGYSFVLPDMIGGNGYVGNSPNETSPPTKELFVRWLQANVFMPSMQYSFVPWDYDTETIEICKTFTKLHAEYAPKIIELMKNAVNTGAPINPPIWWVDPSNTKAHKINDEFLLGDEILVAPVIEEGATSRDVYLPDGQWHDPMLEKDYAGPILLSDYPAPLNVLPYFIKNRR